MSHSSQIFTKESASAIIDATITTGTKQDRKPAAIPESNELAEDLNNAYRNYSGWKESFEIQPTPKQMDDSLTKVQKKTKSLIESLDELQNKLEAHESIHPSKTLFATNDIIEETIPNLEIILGYIDLLNSKPKTSIPTASRSPKAETDLVRRLLADVYSTHFQAKVGISRTPDGFPSDPMLRFIRSCLSHMDLKLTDEAIASAIKKT